MKNTLTAILLTSLFLLSTPSQALKFCNKTNTLLEIEYGYEQWEKGFRKIDSDDTEVNAHTCIELSINNNIDLTDTDTKKVYYIKSKFTGVTPSRSTLGKAILGMDQISIKFRTQTNCEINVHFTKESRYRFSDINETCDVDTHIGRMFDQ